MKKGKKKYLKSDFKKFESDFRAEAIEQHSALFFGIFLYNNFFADEGMYQIIKSNKLKLFIIYLYL